MGSYFLKRINLNTVCLALLVGIIISLLQIFETVSLKLLMDNQFYDSPYTKWLSIDPFNFSPVIFFILLPLIGSIPGGNLLKEDIDSGFIRHLRIHYKPLKILKGYVTTAFILGFLVIFSILITNYLLYFLMLPNIIPNMMLNNNLLINNQNTMLVSIYYSHPFCHGLLSIVFCSCFAGLFAAFVSVNGLIINNKFTVLISSLLLEVCLLMANTFIQLPNKMSYVPSDFLKESANENLSLVLSLTITVLLSLYVLTVMTYGRKKLAW